MDKKEALRVVTQVCAAYKGTLDEHKVIGQALEALEDKPKEQ